MKADVIYTKEDLVEFCKWNSNAPVSVLRKAPIEALENLIERGNAWDSFFSTLAQYRECRQLEKQIAASKKRMGLR